MHKASFTLLEDSMRPLGSALLGLSALCATPSLSFAVETAKTELGAPQASQTQVDATDRERAATWGLNFEEYRRYQSLMRGIRGSISDSHISPIEVLGVHARSDAERRKYAEMFARIMAEDTQRVLQFQIEYQAAFQRMFPNLPVMVIDPAAARTPNLQQVLEGAPKVTPANVKSSAASAQSPRSTGMSTPTQITKGDRLIVFSSASCKACSSTVTRAISHVDQGVSVDLYVVGAKKAEDVVGYAKQIGIDVDLVRSGRVTLNLDSGTMARVLPGQSNLPQIVRKRGEWLMALGGGL